MKNMITIIFIVILTIIIITSVVLYLIANYLYNLALNPNTPKDLILGGKEKTQEQLQEEQKRNEEITKWLKENSIDVYVMSDDKLKLHAYEIENKQKSDIWVIAIHGYTGSADEMIEAIKKYIDMGYNVLAIDLRGHGKSEGNYIGMGWPDRLDVLNWISHIIDKNENNKIILYGISMGASTTMMTTGEKLPENVKLAIADCGYTSVWDEFADKLNSIFKLPTFPILNAANVLSKSRAGYDFKEASSVEQIKKSKTPTLFIHGDQDKFVPFWMLEKLYKSANCEKEKLVVEGASHAQSQVINPELYWRTIERFIKKYI